MSADLSSRVRNVMAATFGVPAGEITGATDSKSIKAWSSMNHLHLIVALEAEFSVSFEPEQAVELTSVAAIEQALTQMNAK